MMISRTALFLPGLALLAAFAAPSMARAEGEELAQCAAKWIEANQNPKFYEPWGDYFTDCKKKLAEGAAAPKAEEAKPAASAPAPEPEAKKAEPPKPAPATAAPAPAPAPAATPAPTPAKPAKPAHKPAKKPAH
jgi:outer membrane biosynthesis protein TonB